MAHDIFISFSSQDKATAIEVCAALEGAGIKCWISSRDIVAGGWGAAIIRAIRTSKILILVLSYNSNKSRHVVKEVERAHHHGAIIFPLRIEEVIPSENLEYFISDEQWFDALTPPLEEHLHLLAARVKLKLSEIVEPVEARPVPTATILSQTLGVSHHQDPNGQEGFMYAPAPLGEVAQDSVFVPIKWLIVQQHIREIRARVEDLTRRALVGQKREQSNIESAASTLAASVLPAAGFVGMMGAGINPQFDLIHDAASEIPWEVLEEFYFTCSACYRNTLPRQSMESTEPYCERCGTRMKPAGGKLALTLHLTHLVRGGGRPSGEGQQFLFIEDPEGDLCRSDRDPAGICTRHLSDLRQIVEQGGYLVSRLRNSEATVEAVRKALADPTLAGVYYFGHGFFPHGGDEGCLSLADGQIYASQIKALEPTAKLVFLNACEGAVAGRNWEIEKRSSSVGNAFARGGRGRVVIAPIWPMVNVQAAETALEFFRQASSGTASLGEALRITRQKSLEQYNDGDPHLAWMAYRYFGDPNKQFLSVGPPVISGSSVSKSGSLPRVFDANDQLNTELFAFGMDEVLLYAARRRNLQHRSQITLADFFTGVLRKGDLTRFVLGQHGISPDKLYQAMFEPGAQQDAVASEMGEPVIDGPGDLAKDDDEEFDFDSADAEQLREFLLRWIVRHRNEFETAVIKLLESADVLAQGRGVRTHDRRISEQDLLESLIANEAWLNQAAACGLPAQGDIRRVLEERESAGEIDENGALTLKLLNPGAREIINNAHDLAQQRGLFPIPNRLMFAALLGNEKGPAAKACEAAGVKREALLGLMTVATEQGSVEDNPPLSFGLGLEACARIVLPVIEEAKKIAREQAAITEEDLFKAFCKVSTPEFKEWLKQPPDAIDLDSIGGAFIATESHETISLEGLDQRARAIVETAHVMAQKCGAYPIPNRLMLAAFLLDQEGYAARLLKKKSSAAGGLCQQLLSTFAGGPLRAFPLSPEACERIIWPMLNRARQLSAGLITEKLLFKTFCSVAAPELKQALKLWPLSIDLNALDFDQSESEEELVVSEKGIQAERINKEQFEESAWRIVTEAGRLAHRQGWIEVRTPHLFAAMIGDGQGPTGLAIQGVNVEELKKIVLRLVPNQTLPPDAPPPVPSLGEHARLIVTTATQRAASQGRHRVTEEDLFVAFFADGGGVVGDVLRSLGIDPRKPLMSKGPKVGPSNNGHGPHQG